MAGSVRNGCAYDSIASLLFIVGPLHPPVWFKPRYTRSTATADYVGYFAYRIQPGVVAMQAELWTLAYGPLHTERLYRARGSLQHSRVTNRMIIHMNTDVS